MDVIYLFLTQDSKIYNIVKVNNNLDDVRTNKVTYRVLVTVPFVMEAQIVLKPKLNNLAFGSFT